MESFERYIPKKDTVQEKGGVNFRFNTFSQSNPVWKKFGPDYTLVYGENIDATAYNKPGVRDYTMNVVDPKGNIMYEWERREYKLWAPQENYEQPRFNQVNFWGWDLNKFVNTTSLEEFKSSISGVKEDTIRSYGINSKEYASFEKKAVFILADMQRVWAWEGNYNTDIIPSAGKVSKMEALRNALNQLGKDIPSDETMFNQWSLWSNPEKIICRDFAIVTARIAKSIGFDAIAGTTEVGISHAFTVMRSKETGMYYGISADSVGGASKIFEGKSLAEIRQNYQNELISLGRAQHFGGVYLDDAGKVIGKWLSPLEEQRSNDFLGGVTPTRLLDSSVGTTVTLNHGDIGMIDYTSLIAQKWTSIEGEYIDANLFFRWGITNMGIGKTNTQAFDAGMGGKLSTKSAEIASWFTARAYIASDINISVGYSQDKGSQVPYISGNSVIGGQMKYVNNKWTFTTDLWKTYELSGPNQMQSPLMKILPSGEYAIFAWEYKGESMNMLGRAVFENYFIAQRKEFSLGLRHNSGFGWAIYTKSEKNNVPGFPVEWSRETGLGATWDVSKNTQLRANVGKKQGPGWSGNTVGAGINIQF